MLPVYKNRRRHSSNEFSISKLLSFLKSPGMRRILYILLVLPIPIITFFLGRYFSPVIRPSIELSSFQSAINGTHRKSLGPDRNWDKFAFALKTGKDVALKRTPIQLMTFLQPVKNIILIGEEPNVFVADYPMIDVVSATMKAGEDVGHGIGFNLQLVRPPKMQHDPVQGHLLKRELAEVVVDQESKGWKLDAKKNIPGFKLLYERYPDVDWYVMIDDDTYMFMDNVLDKLKNYNPNDPHYLGAPTNFIGCDGVKTWGESIYFAHGGSGIIISRGAMLKMIPIIDSCIKKYDSCWAGDIRTSLCLRDAGIMVENAGYFSPDAPNDRFNFTYPCATPRTFHHLLSHQIQKLFELEMVAKAQSQTILLDDVFRAFLDESPKMNYDRPGGDFKSAKTATGDECKALCASITKCVAYTFENGGCHLKSTAPPIKKRNTGCVTGLITSHFVCNKH